MINIIVRIRDSAVDGTLSHLVVRIRDSAVDGTLSHLVVRIIYIILVLCSVMVLYILELI